FLLTTRLPRSTLFPYTTLFRSYDLARLDETEIALLGIGRKFQKPTVFDMHTVEDNIALALKGDRRARKTLFWQETEQETKRIDRDRKSTRLNSSHSQISYAVFC